MTHSDVDSPLVTSALPPPPRSGEVERLGHYLLEEQIGSGGMGIVYRARDLRTDSRVAVKLLKQAHPRAIAAFKREFRALAGIHHENLATLFELAYHDEQWYLAMELVRGGSFVDYAEDDEDRLRDSLGQLARGLAHLHAAGNVHRDVKPSNVLVQPDGRVVVLDFGLVSHLPDRHRTEPGKYVIGTVDYIAPEMVAVGGRLSPAADWYSVGVMLYRCLTGQRPYRGSRYDILRSKLDRDPPHPHELVPDAPADLAELCVSLMARDPAVRGGAAEIAAVLGGTAPAPRPRARTSAGTGLIGRGRHLLALDAAATAVKLGSPVAVCVHGASGMGKSALVGGFLSSLSAEAEILALTGRCYEGESVPYKGVDAAIDRLAAALARMPRARIRRLVRGRDLEQAARLFPALAGLPGIAISDDEIAEGGDQPQRLRERAFVALRALLHRLAGGRLVVLAIDDAQWLDRDGAELLAALTSGPTAPPILTILSFRSGEGGATPLGELVARLADDRDPDGLREVEVGALPPVEAEALARALGDDLGTRDWRPVVERAAGSPYLLSELVRYLRIRPESIAAPPLDRVIAARLSALPAGAGPLLELVCLAGHPVEASALVAAAGVGDGAAALAALRAAHLIRGRPSGIGDAVEPYHDRIRETVAAAVDRERAARLHLALAVALEQVGGTPAEQLALHYYAAGRSVEAARYTAVAAAEATRALAFDRAASLYRRALSAGLSDAEQVPLWAGLGDALSAAGHAAAAASAYHEGAQVAGGIAALGLRSRSADQLLRSGRVAAGVDAFRSVLADQGVATASTPRRALWAGLRRRAWLRLRGLGFREADGPLDPARAIQVDSLYSVASGFALVDPMRAMEVQARHTAAALALGDPFRVARALASHAAPLAAGGNRSARRCDAVLARAEEVASRAGHPHPRALVELVRGFAGFCRGAWREARDHLERAESIFETECVGAAWELATCRFFQLNTMIRLGDYRTLIDSVDAWLVDAERRNDLHALSNLGVGAAWQALAADDPARAHAAVDQSTLYWDHSTVALRRYRGLYMHAVVGLYEGDYAAAEAAVDGAVASARASMVDRIQEVALSLRFARAQVALGRAAEASGGARRAQLRAARRQLRAIERTRATWALGQALVMRSWIDQLTGAPERAASRLADGIEILEATSMRAHAAAARRARGRLIRGDEGRALAGEGERQLAALGAVNPGRLADSLAGRRD